MQWAEGGSLDDFIDARLGRSVRTQFRSSEQSPDASPSMGGSSTSYSRSARIRAFRALQHASPEDRDRLRRELAMSASAGQQRQSNGPANWLAVHLLSPEEVKALFTDVVGGLAFLVRPFAQRGQAHLLTYSSARSVHLAFRSQTGQCPPYMGTGQVDVRSCLKGRMVSINILITLSQTHGHAF